MTGHPNTSPGTPGADGVPGALQSIQRQVGELAQTLWPARRPTELMDTIAEIGRASCRERVCLVV